LKTARGYNRKYFIWAPKFGDTSTPHRKIKVTWKIEKTKKYLWAPIEENLVSIEEQKDFWLQYSCPNWYDLLRKKRINYGECPALVVFSAIFFSKNWQNRKTYQLGHKYCIFKTFLNLIMTPFFHQCRFRHYQN